MNEIALTKDIDEYLEDVYQHIARRDLENALKILDKAYSIDFDRSELGELLRLLKFWKERWQRLDEFASLYEKGDYLMDQWDQFLVWYRKRQKMPLDRGIQCLRYMVHSESLNCYEQMHLSDCEDQELHLRIGRCNKVLGNYEKAVSVLEKGVRINRENPSVLAELADTYALVDEMKGAKIFFREAFFINPQLVDLSRLESGLIRKVIEKISDIGFEGETVNEWLPVYAVIFGVFNIKRELRPISTENSVSPSSLCRTTSGRMPETRCWCLV